MMGRERKSRENPITNKGFLCYERNTDPHQKTRESVNIFYFRQDGRELPLENNEQAWASHKGGACGNALKKKLLQ